MRKRQQRVAFAIICAALLAGEPLVSRGHSQPVRPPAQVAETRQTNSNSIDINTATIAELKSLPGMGDAYARRVVAYRPYTAKNQLVSRGVLPAEVYEKISPLITARHPK